MTRLITALDHRSRSLPRIAPREIIEMPKRVDRQDEIPNRQGDEVDEHPEDVDGAVGGDDDEETGEAEDEGEEDEGDCGRRGVGCEGYEGFGDCAGRKR